MAADRREDQHVKLIQQGLFVEKVTRPITLDTEPKDGFEFIYKSRLEDALLDYSPKQKQNTSPAKENHDQTPTTAMVIWGREQASAFTRLAHKLKNNKRTLIQKFPKTVEFPDLDEKDWCTFCLGSNMCAQVFGEDSPARVVAGHLPLLSIVLHLDRKQLMQLICWHHKWFKAVDMTLGISVAVQVVEAISMWTYALCCNLHKPLDATYEKQLEELYDAYKEALDSLDDSNRDRLYLIVAILKHYFGVKYYKNATSWNTYHNSSYYCQLSSSESSE